MRVNMGEEYEDVVTGLRGACVGLAQYITGCNQALITSRATKNKESLSMWIDEQRLKRVGKNKITLDNGQNPGCDLAAPIK